MSPERKAELQRLNKEMDKALGIKPRQPTPLIHTEKNLSPEKRKALNALELTEQKPTPLKRFSPQMEAKLKEFDNLLKNKPDPGTGKWKLGPVTPEERLRCWHRALGTKPEIVEQEVAQLKEQLAKKEGSR